LALSEAYSTPERQKSATRPKSGRRKAAPLSRTVEDYQAELESESTLGWLFFDIHRLFSRDFDGRVRDLGLTRSQWRVLFAVHRAQGGMSQTELADLTEVDKAPLGKILDKLEDGGWIIRKKHPTDRRARLVYATSKIDKHADRLAQAAKGTFAQMLQGVRQNEVKDLIARLEKLKRNLGGAGD
jgi:DNA-binding MarR family transcriptional regulator